MEKVVLIIHVFVSLALIGLVLLQYAKGAEAGAAWGGGGASQTFFGSQGASPFLTRTTAVMATLFFITCLTLGYLVAEAKRPKTLERILHHKSEIPKIPE